MVVEIPLYRLTKSSTQEEIQTKSTGKSVEQQNFLCTGQFNAHLGDQWRVSSQN